VTTKRSGSSTKKGASRASLKPPPTNTRRKTPPPKADDSHHKRKKHSLGVTSAQGKRSAKRFGTPAERMKARLAREEQQGELTPLRPDDNLLKLSKAAARIGIATWTLRDWALKGKCIYRRVGSLLLMIPESEVERLRSTHGN
jgi:hypothetical protein